MENFASLLAGFQVALAPENIGVCLLGAILGLVVGAMPGIGSLRAGEMPPQADK